MPAGIVAVHQTRTDKKKLIIEIIPGQKNGFNFFVTTRLEFSCFMDSSFHFAAAVTTPCRNATSVGM